MSPKETEQLNATLDKRIKDMLKEDAEKRGMSMTEYLENLIEGNLQGRLENKMEAIRDEILVQIEALRKEIGK